MAIIVALVCFDEETAETLAVAPAEREANKPKAPAGE
jgi:hypothetical protein